MLTLQDRKSGIYCIEDLITHRKYIGQSTNMYSRQRKHICELNNGEHYNEYLQNVWTKYGAEKFDFSVLEYCDSDLLDERECYYIDKYNTLDRSMGYNLASGGQMNKNMTTDYVREKVRKGVKNSYNESLRLRRSEQLKTQWSDPETRAKLSKGGMHGRHHTDEVKQRLSALHKGKSVNAKYFDRVLCVETGVIYDNVRVAAKVLSLDSSCIIKVCKGERYVCGGYHWKFVN